MTIKGKFNIDVYNCDVYIIISNNLRRCINNRLRKQESKDSIDFDPSGYFLRCGDDVSNYYLFYDSAYLNHRTINHEKSHLLDYVLQDREIPAIDEVRSYLDGFVSRKLNAFFQRRKIKIE